MVTGSQYPRRIRNAMIVYYMPTILIILSLLGLSLYVVTKRNLENEMGKRLISIAALTAADIPAWLLPQIVPGTENSRSFELLRTRLEKATRTGQVNRVYIADAQNRAIVDTDAKIRTGMPYFEHALYEHELQKVRGGKNVHTPLFLGNDKTYYKLAFVPLYSEGALVGMLAVRASADFFASLRSLRRYLFYSVFLISILIIGISVLISGTIVQPIERLVNAAKRIGTGDLQTPVSLPYLNEFGLLGASIDEMRRELREKNQRMQAMMQGIAHEIRNPLGGIELFAGLLSEEIAPEQKQQLQSVQRIKDEVRNLKLTVEQFLDFARDPSPQPEDVDAAELLEETLISLKLEADRQGVRLRADADPGMRLWVDRRLMKSVLINLAQNSLQAIHAAGRGAGEISLQCRVQGESGEISVQDNGCGIPEADLPNLFRPFFTTKEKGCGLGLAFCEKIVHSHNGEIEVDSVFGKGTRIRILLPHKPPGGA